ncbi:carbohydrate ABC transporter permease [Fictibacillus enclensis]|uniref:carbohydrate ABC transporter permease n=1 Tax=Fictibacillus enclensis TaxID=1017270 RepID=UPI0025A16210|nr:carbohydrate ABC transporter permease [Fictibacillus enclensis]MDM5200942.1 carbohydrate ABC transporter permease [Fictibacillus enclensis]
MNRKQNTALSKVSVNAFFILLCLVTLFPLFSLVLASLKPSTELLRFGLNMKLDFHVMSFKNYAYLFQGGSIYFEWFKNSLLLLVISTALTLFFSSMVGYGLAVYSFKGKNVLFLLVLFIMMVPLEIMMLPLFKMTVALKIVDSYTGVILPFIVAPVAVFFFRQYALSLPRALLESARVDGCTEFGIFLRIMMPLMKPAFGAMAILQAMGSWNNFLWPLIVLRSKEMLTLPIGFASLLSPYGNNYDLLISGAVLAVIPIIIIFLFFQKYFISGLTSGGIKG